MQVTKIDKPIDLAGSETAESTGATGIRPKEGPDININKSFTTWGKVDSHQRVAKR